MTVAERVRLGTWAVSIALLMSCADSGRAPTSPTGVVLTAPAMNWACLRQAASTGGPDSGWTFRVPAADCPVAPAVPDVGIGLVSAAPGNLRSTITGTTVRLDWNGLTEAVTSFLVEAGSAPTLANLARLSTGSAALALVVNGVPNGVYYVRVRAIGPDGIPGPASNEIVVRVGVGLPCSSAPLAPTGLSAQIATNQVTLNWVASAGDAASTYVVEAGSGPSLANIVVFDTGNPGTQLSAFAPNGTYYVRLRGQNACGTGAPSNEIIVLTPSTGGGQTVDCTYTVSADSAQAPSSGGEFQLNVATQPGCAWSARSDGGFITLTSPTTAIGNGVARFSAGANNTGQSRQGVVRIEWTNSGQAVTISQEATPLGGGGGGGGTPPPCTYSVPQASVDLLPNGGEFEVSVTTAVGCGWSASSAFAELRSPGSLSGPTAARFAVSDNPGSTQRAGLARISWPGGGQDVAIAQQGQPAPNPGGSNTTTTITTPPQTGIVDQPVQEPPPNPCPRANAGCLQAGTAAATAGSVIPNATTTVVVTAPPGSPGFNRIYVAEGIAAPGSAPAAASYRLLSLSSVRTSVTLGFTVAATQAFTASFAIGRDAQLPSDYFAVTIPAPCVYALAGPAVPLANVAGTFDVGVKTGAQCSWSATAPASSFISVTNGTDTGPGTARFSVTANPLTTTRSSSVTVAGQSLTITQASNRVPRFTSPFCSFAGITPGGTITCPGAAIDDDAGDLITWTPTASHTCSWFAVGSHTPANPSSLSLGGMVPSNFTGTCNINIAVCDQRLGCTPYTGSYTWNPTCTYVVTPTSTTISALAGTFDVTVKALNGCAWTASSQASFISLQSATGSGTGVARFSFATNTSASATRSGTVRIAWAGGEQIVNVTQQAQ